MTRPRSPPRSDRAPLRAPRMRRSLAKALVPLLLFGGDAAAQILDDTLVPRGQLRLQAHPIFERWDSRFGRTDDGTRGREDLGDDLTDPDGARLFPGLVTLGGYVEELAGPGVALPALGVTQGRVTKDVTRVEFGGHLGVFDWLTIGVVVPWIQTRTAIDLAFTPDTAGGDGLGLNPTLTAAPAVDGYLAALGGAAVAARDNATAVCAAGPGPECEAAQALAARTEGFLGSAQGAYGASPFFPLGGSSAAAALAAASATLDADLVAAGLSGIGATMAFAGAGVTAEDILTLPALGGAGINGSPLRTRRGLWQTGDIEVSALLRLLDREPSGPSVAGLSYRVSVGGLVRLGTGAPEDPDVFLDVGTGDGQVDVEGRVIGALSIGRLGLAVGGRYGVQEPRTLVKRVAPLEAPMPELATRQLVRWSPASYVEIEAAPTLRFTRELSFSGRIRYFEKGRDVFELVESAPALDPDVLGRESGMKLTQLGAGLRYSTVAQWREGVATRPLEAHLRLIWAAAGSGGHTPEAARIEAGIRLFKRFWGPEPNR